MAGPDGDAVHEQFAGALDHRGGVVVAAGARPGDHDHEIRDRRRLPHDRLDLRRVVRHDRRRVRLAARLARLGDEHQRVRVHQLAGGGLLADRTDLVPGRDDAHPRRAAHRERGVAGGRRGGDVDRPQPVPLGQEQLGRAHVLPDRAHVLPRRDRGAHRRHLAVPVDVLAHDDRVIAVGQRVAGVDDREVRDRHRRRLRRAERVRRPHGDPVHRARVIGGRGAQRPHRCGGHAPGRLVQRHLDRLRPPPFERPEPRGERLLRRHVVQEGTVPLLASRSDPVQETCLARFLHG